MKILNRIAATACLFGAVLLVSCESPDLSTAHESQVNGLLNVTIQIPDNPTEFYATKKGPYEEGEEITVKVPTTDEDPLDVSRLICTVSVEHNCYVVPGVGGEMDFTEPYKITVIDALGIYGQYLAVQEYNGPIYLYDMKTGAAVKTIDAARSFMMKARTDDAGHLITSRENIYGAGFMVFYYSEADQEHKLLLDYTAGDGCPGDLGYNMNVAGDVTSGTAYIYGTGPNDMTIYYWKLQDGQLVTPANQPNKLRYGPAGSSWTAAPAIQRVSLADDSDHYISYTKWVNGNSDEALKSRFNIFTTSMEVTALNAADHEYRLLGFNVFKVENDTYLALNDQGADQWAGGGATLKVFDITNTSKMELGPDDDGYSDFCVFTSDMSAWGQNYFSWGDVAVYKEVTSTGYDVYIATSVVGFDLSQSIVRMYKMSYFRQ